MKVLYGVATATVSRTGRVSTVRWNLKEPVGKALVRRTGTAYEAVPRLGEFARQNKTLQLLRSGCVDAADVWGESIHSYPRRPHPLLSSKPRCKAWLRGEESAEGIVAAEPGGDQAEFMKRPSVGIQFLFTFQVGSEGPNVRQGVIL